MMNESEGCSEVAGTKGRKAHSVPIGLLAPHGFPFL